MVGDYEFIPWKETIIRIINIMAYRIESKDILNFEIIHYAEDTRMIASSHRRMLIQDGKKKKNILYAVHFNGYIRKPENNEAFISSR